MPIFNAQVFWICAGIAVVVFGAMIYSLVKLRRSHQTVPAMLAQGLKVEIIWTIIPVLILVAAAMPAAELILNRQDTPNSELSIRVTGYQWGWRYQYMDAGTGIDFFSTLKPESNITPGDPLDVDKPLVIPSGTKVHLLLTSMDVIHAWWIPELGAKRSAIPGFVNEFWVTVDAGKEGIYRGRCAALCGRDHAFMPLVVDVRTPDDFKKWVARQIAVPRQ